MRREKTSLPVDVRRSKTSLLKFPNKWARPFFLGLGGTPQVKLPHLTKPVLCSVLPLSEIVGDATDYRFDYKDVINVTSNLSNLLFYFKKSRYKFVEKAIFIDANQVVYCHLPRGSTVQGVFAFYSQLFIGEIFATEF